MCRAIAFMAVAAFLLCFPARAETDPEDEPLLGSSQETTITKSPALPFTSPAGETWIGADGFRRVASLYSGVTWALSGDITHDGLRLRAAGNTGLFSRTTVNPTAENNPICLDKTKYDPKKCEATIPVVRTTAQILVGWQHRFGDTTVKAFAGLAYASEKTVTWDARHRLHGPRLGPALALEIWHNITPALWTSIDLSFARPDMERSIRQRLGLRLNETLSFGPEYALAARNDVYSLYPDGEIEKKPIGRLLRLGLFARWDTPTYEFSVSAGSAISMSQVYPDDKPSPPSLYLSAQYLSRF